MLGKKLLTKKAQEKSLTSIQQSLMQARTARLAGETWYSIDSRPGMAFIEEGG
jgi:hypothetical protein